MRYLLPFLAATLLLIVACTPPTLETPTVTATAIENGAKLRLTWTAITNASGYNVYLDGTKNSITTTSYDVTTPTKLIEVSAYSGSEESDKWSLNTGVVKTTSVSVDNKAGTGTNKAFYFNASGTAIAIPLTQTTDIDFVLDTAGINTELRGPTSYDPDINSKDNASAQATSTDFDAYNLAEATGGSYNTVRTLSNGGLYSLWIDPNGNGWTTDDRFAKMKVENISGNTLTLTFGYQKVGGLRWLKNP